jgi:protein SCO1/2
MILRRSLPWLLVLGVLAALSGAYVARMLSQKTVALQGGTLLPAPRALGAFELASLDGQPFGPAQLAGSPGLLFLGFTYCPDVCPTTLATLRDLMRAPPVPGLRVLFVTVDPERDDAATLARYLGAFDARFVGLRGDAGALAPLLRSLGAIAVRQPLPGGSYTMDHTAALYLLDRSGRLAAVFTPPFDAAILRADLARLAPRLQ